MIFVSYFEVEEKLVHLLQKQISFFEKSFGASPKIIGGREQKKLVGCSQKNWWGSPRKTGGAVGKKFGAGTPVVEPAPEASKRGFKGSPVGFGSTTPNQLNLDFSTASSSCASPISLRAVKISSCRSAEKVSSTLPSNVPSSKYPFKKEIFAFAISSAFV